MNPFVKMLDRLLGLLTIGLVVLMMVPGGLRWEFTPLTCWLLVATFLGDRIFRLALSPNRAEVLRVRALDFLLAIPLIFRGWDLIFAAQLIVISSGFFWFREGLFSKRLRDFLETQGTSPAKLVAFSFLLAIAAGTFLLALPISGAKGVSMGFRTALFMSTSAICVTGLSVVDVSSTFSLFGEIVLLFLIQIGGLGIMTLGTFYSLFLASGGGVGLRNRVGMLSTVSQGTAADLRQLILNIFRLTLLIEFVGAIFLSYGFYATMSPTQQNPMGLGRAIYLGFFHAISAFCNAGFSLFSDSLIGYRDNPLIIGVMMVLIILGGLGFVVLFSFGRLFAKRSSQRVFFVHDRLVLTTTAALLIGGALVLFLAEYSTTVFGQELGERVAASFFLSTTSRTAGFNTVDMALLSNASLFFVALLMFLGGSPGGTAGGVKTTTAAVLFLSIRNLMRGQTEIEVAGRAVPQRLVQQAIAVVLISFSVLTVGMFSLLAVENAPFREVFFEAVSAFGTVGLSTGLTPKLTPLGQLIIVFLMFIGRIGPLTFALAIGQTRRAGVYRLPEAQVAVG